MHSLKWHPQGRQSALARSTSSSKRTWVGIGLLFALIAYATDLKGSARSEKRFKDLDTIADIRRELVPSSPSRQATKAFQCAASDTARRWTVHSITSSARMRMEGGISRPSAFVVFALITNLNNLGSSNGRSSGFDPLRMRSTRTATRSKLSLSSGP